MPRDAASVAAAAMAPTRPGLPVLPPPAALVEILLLIGVPTALDYWLPAFPSLSDMQPHFFWLPVLLLSLQYGTVSGLLAAGAAIAAAAVLGFAEQEIGENHLAYLLRVWAQPMLWLAAALVLGQFRMRQIEQKQELARQVAELASQRKAISEYAGNLRLRCEHLERELVGRPAAAGADVLLALGRLASREPETARAALGQCLDLALGPCQASIFIRDGDQLRLAEPHGWAATAQWRRWFGASDPLFAAVVEEARPVSVLSPGDEAVLAGEGIAAVPLCAAAHGPVIAMVKLEACQPGVLDDELVVRLAVLAAQMAPQLEERRLRPQAIAAVASAAVRAGHEVAARPRLWRQVRWRRGSLASDAVRKPPRAG
jgi:hypothetical protein